MFRWKEPFRHSGCTLQSRHRPSSVLKARGQGELRRSQRGSRTVTGQRAFGTMRNRLLLVIALATLGATVGASVVSAASGDGVIGVGESGSASTFPAAPTCPTSAGVFCPPARISPTTTATERSTSATRAAAVRLTATSTTRPRRRQSPHRSLTLTPPAAPAVPAAARSPARSARRDRVSPARARSASRPPAAAPAAPRPRAKRAVAATATATAASSRPRCASPTAPRPAPTPA